MLQAFLQRTLTASPIGQWVIATVAVIFACGVVNPASARVLLHCQLDAPTPAPLPGTVVATSCIDHGGQLKAVTVGGDPVWGAGRPGTGLPGDGAVVFDGAGDYLLLPNSPLLNGLREITVEAWVKVTGSAWNVFRVQQPLALDGDRVLVRNSQQASPWYTLDSGSPTPSDWYHVAGVFDRGELRLYVNGRLSNVSIVGVEELGSYVDYFDWALGARYLGGGADQFFAGSIDEVTLYDEALPAKTLLEHARNSVLTQTLDVTQGANPALGDGSTDDAAAIQARIDTAAVTEAEVYIPSGIYRLGETLRIPSRILVRGDPDTILEPIENLTSPANPIFALDDDGGEPVVESTIRDLQIRGRSSEIAQNAGHAAFILTGTRLCHIDGVEIQDLGKKPDDIGGIQILMQSLSLGSAPGAGRDTLGNVIENNHLDDTGRLASFGIRVSTLWVDVANRPVPPPVTVFTHDNVIKNNYLEGFLQGIEIAGPGTKENWIRGNVSVGAAVVGVEADKGAIANTFVDNVVGLPRNPGSIVLTAMRDQGFRECDGSVLAFEFVARDNVFRRNVIMDVRNPKYAGGILLARTEDGIFEDNFIRDIVPSNQGSAAVLERTGEVTGYTLTGNQISEVPGQANVSLLIPPDGCSP